MSAPKLNVLEKLAAEIALDLVRTTAIPAAATEAVVAGFESPSLIELAGLTRDQAIEAAAQLFEKSLRELSITMPTEEQAVMLLAHETAQGIVDGTVGAREGAGRISWLQRHISYQICDENWTKIAGFIYCDSEWDDRPEDAAFFETAIIEEAKAFIQSDRDKNL